MSNTQLTNYSPESMNIYRGKFSPSSPSLPRHADRVLLPADYATSLGPTPKPAYTIVHDRYPMIQVPRGCLPIRIVQFAPLDGRTGSRQWAIFIPTSTTRGVGNFYEIVGTLQTGYYVLRLINGRHPRWDNERGSHIVGWVAPSFLAMLETHLSMVPIHQGKPEWNGQMWVADALKGLNQTHLFAVQMEYHQWFQQMEIVEEAWDVGEDV